MNRSKFRLQAFASSSGWAKAEPSPGLCIDIGTVLDEAAISRSSLRVVTYNIRRCLGNDGHSSLDRIAEVLAECEADVIALQEVDVCRKRSGGVDQAERIGARLGVSEVHFHPALQVADERYGDAILTRGASRLVKAELLPRGGWLRPAEPRGAIWIEAQLGSCAVQVFNTHLGLGRRERQLQAEALLGEAWLGSPACRGPVVLAGDFNSMPFGTVYRRLARHLGDVSRGPPRASATFPARKPVLRIDHIFASPHFDVLSARVHRSPLSRVASDHLPLVAELGLRPPPPAQKPVFLSSTP